MKTAKELFLASIENNEVHKYLMGVGEYKVPVPHMVPVYTPTDWDYIIPGGIYEAYKDRPDLKIKELFENALIFTLDQGNIGIYAVMNLLFDQLMREKDSTAIFKINTDNLILLIKDKLLKTSEELKKDFSWMGKGQPEGLWTEIKRIDKSIFEETGIKIM